MIIPGHLHGRRIFDPLMVSYDPSRTINGDDGPAAFITQIPLTVTVTGGSGNFRVTWDYEPSLTSTISALYDGTVTTGSDPSSPVEDDTPPTYNQARFAVKFPTEVQTNVMYIQVKVEDLTTGEIWLSTPAQAIVCNIDIDPA